MRILRQRVKLPKITHIVQAELGIKAQLLAIPQIKLLSLRKQGFSQKQRI